MTVFVVEGLTNSILLQVIVSTMVAGAEYIVLLRLLRVREAEQIWRLIVSRIRPR